MKKIFLVLFLLTIAIQVYAQSSKLFVIERSKNANIVRYDAILDKDGKIDKNNPVDAYWLLYAKGNGERENLSAFDKKGYGFKTTYNKTDDNFTLVLKAVKERPMTLNIYDNVAKVIIKINNTDCFLDKVYIKSKDGAFGIPKVFYYKLFGTDVKTGKQIEEQINVE